MEGLRLTFPKVKIPGGGVLQFEMESDNPERPDYVPELEGILLFNHPANSYWPEGEEYEERGLALNTRLIHSQSRTDTDGKKNPKFYGCLERVGATQ